MLRKHTQRLTCSLLPCAKGHNHVCAAAPQKFGVPLPEGFMPEGFMFRKYYSKAKPLGSSEYVVTCPVHARLKRLDRWRNVVDFFAAHAKCR